jgi:hypothetical protein
MRGGLLGSCCEVTIEKSLPSPISGHRKEMKADGSSRAIEKLNGEII